MNTGEYIKMLRIQKGLTLEELGALVGVGKSTVRKWETGAISNMRKDKIQKLADALGVSPMDLIQEAYPSVIHPADDLDVRIIARSAWPSKVNEETMQKYLEITFPELAEDRELKEHKEEVILRYVESLPDDEKFALAKKIMNLID